MASDEVNTKGLDVLRSAFEPLRCVAEMYDYNSKARFRVYGQQDEPLLRMEKIEPYILGDRRLLSEIIEATRHKLVNRGIALRAWSMPVLIEQPSGGAA